MIAEYRNGQELIENYDTTTDLIFLDIQMNKMDGLTAAEKYGNWMKKSALFS